MQYSLTDILKIVRLTLVVLSSVLVFSACKQQTAKESQPSVQPTEDLQAKELLQGIWKDELSEEVSFKVDGDTVYYPDVTDQPAYFRIVGDTLELGHQHYPVVRLTADAFCFVNPAGDEVSLIKGEASDWPSDYKPQEPQIVQVSDVVKRDSVVMYGGERYHWYVYVNPTRYRVTRTAYSADGVATEKVYFDNIIHVSLFQGNRKLFSNNFNKQMFAKDVPEQFLSQAILGNMQYRHADSEGFHFDATVCIPDEASCYVIETIVSYTGDVNMKLLDY